MFDRYDEYGRKLAGVFKSATLVNAQIAREGLGVAVAYDPNYRFFLQVQEAQQEGVLAGRGMYSTQASCTIPAAVKEYIDLAEELERAAADAEHHTDEALFAYLAMRDTASTRYQALSVAFGDDDRKSFPFLSFAGITQETAQRYRYDNREVVQTIRNATSAIDSSLRQLESELEDRAERREEERGTEERSERRPGSSGRAGSPSGGSGNTGYTGCRAYDPGGKAWRPIGC